jgi:hypothetical protein
MSDHSLFEVHRVDSDAADIAGRVAAGLARDGLVTFEPGPARAGVLRLALRLMIPWPHRDADTDGITLIRDQGALAARPGYAGFGTSALDAHTELSSAACPPALLMLTCVRAASSGGASFIIDGAAVHADLVSEEPDLAAALARPRIAVFGNPGRSGAVFEREPCGRLTIRLRLDGLARFSPEIRRVLPLLREVIAEHVVELPLRPGQGFLIDNRRMLHGRRSFKGHRTMYRVLGDPAPGLPLRPGFLAARHRLRRPPSTLTGIHARPGNAKGQFL